MADIDIDLSQLLALGDDLKSAAAGAIGTIRPAVTKAGVNIKQDMRDAAASKHFKFANQINFDQTGNAAYSQVVVGPKKVGAGNLANIAYFGGAHGGGGTIEDPQAALDREAPKLESAILDLIGEL